MCGRHVYEIGEQLGITRILLPDFNGRDHVRLDAAHGMDFEPFVLLAHDAVLRVQTTE